MRRWMDHLDELLRGRRTGAGAFADGSGALPLRVFVPLAVLLGGVYGFFMGWFAVAGRGFTAGAAMQVVASTVKLPALFLLTLVVTFPSLYVFNALVGCRLSFRAALRLLVAAIVIDLAVGASLGPILAFFTLSTTSYPFMIVLNVILLGIAGSVGLGFLLRTLRTLASDADAEAEGTEERLPAASPPAPPPSLSSPITREPHRGASPARAPAGYVPARRSAADGIFKVWVVIYGLVGAQMGWLLRPFIGNPNMEFAWFRPREGSFFVSVLDAVRRLFGG